jgi:hypothetical protein
VSIHRIVEVGAATAQAAINTAARSGGDPDAALLRVGVLEFLRVHASRVSAPPDDRDLVDAYRDWLETAVALYSAGDEAKVREYMRQGAILAAEIALAAARANGTLLIPTTSDASRERSDD